MSVNHFKKRVKLLNYYTQVYVQAFLFKDIMELVWKKQNEFECKPYGRIIDLSNLFKTSQPSNSISITICSSYSNAFLFLTHKLSYTLIKSKNMQTCACATIEKTIKKIFWKHILLFLNTSVSSQCHQHLLNFCLFLRFNSVFFFFCLFVAIFWPLSNYLASIQNTIVSIQ